MEKWCWLVGVLERVMLLVQLRALCVLYFYYQIVTDRLSVPM